MTDGGDEVTRSGELRASHDDRDRVVELLRVAAGDGRLTVEELDERLEKALTARTRGELVVLTRDLPADGGAPRPKEVAHIDCHSGTARRDGRWAVPRRLLVRVRSGNVTLDFTKATITQPLLEIEAEVHGGTLRLLTKPGVVVDADDVTVRSGSVKVGAPWDADVPSVLRIHVSGTVKSGTVTTRRPRRTFWQWLLRRPRPY